MDDLLDFYKRTWWMWLLCVIACVVLAYLVPTVRILFVILIPGLLGYSVYFGMIRGPEMRERK